MGLFGDMKKKREGKKAAKLQAERDAQERLARAREEEVARRQAAVAGVAKQRADMKRKESDQRQERALNEMKAIKEKIALWQKKVDKLQADKRVVLGRLADAKKMGKRMDEVDKRKLAKVNKDIQLTQGQLETLENKLSGIEQAAANVSVVDTLEDANQVHEAIAKPVDQVQDVLAKASEQQQELEDANLEFLLPTNRDEIDEDDLLAELDDFEKEEAYNAGEAAAAAPAPTAIPSVPSKTPVMPAAAANNEEDELEAELRRHEQQSMAAV